MFLFLILCVGIALAAEFTLPGECPNVKLQENLDYTKFSGLWYNIGSYASDGRSIYDCATLDFQEDNLGYTLRETYVNEDQGNRTQKSYFARVDPTFDAGNKAQFIVSHEDGDKVLQFPFFILSTDYDNYAIAYTCKTLKKKQRTHYGICSHGITFTFAKQRHRCSASRACNFTGIPCPSNRNITAWRLNNKQSGGTRPDVLSRSTTTVFTWVLSRNKEALQGDNLKHVENTLSKYSELAEHRASFVFKDFSDNGCSYTNKYESDFFTSNFW